jgi:hypothetical protein
VLARVPAGAELAGSLSDAQWTEVTLEGWIWSASLSRTSQDGHNLRVMPGAGENLRAGPNGSIIARLSQGALLDEMERDGRWVRARRTGWMWSQSLGRLSSTAPTARRSTSADSGISLDRAVIAHAATLRRVPDGDETAALRPETPVRVLARSGEWVRVQTEGWVKEADLRPSDQGVLVGVSGAEVRARPSEYEGRLLQWTVQYLAIQEADELRSDIPTGERYMLARGPLPEAGFVYVVLPTDRLADVERLAPLAQIVIIGRVRVARSQYLGNPIVDLVDMAARQ